MWQVFQVGEEARKLKDGPVEYREFLRVPALNCGIYRLKAGSKDMQGSHDDDEVYYVLEGRARLKVGDKDHVVEPVRCSTSAPPRSIPFSRSTRT